MATDRADAQVTLSTSSFRWRTDGQWTWRSRSGGWSSISPLIACACVKTAFLLVALIGCVACGDVAPATTQSGATPTATALPNAPASPTPTPPAPARAVVTFVNAPLMVGRGSNATLQTKTAPNTSCSIEVDYKSGPSKAAGLGAATSDATGNVSWTWKVGANTTPGSWPIIVTCGSASAQTTIHVT